MKSTAAAPAVYSLTARTFHWATAIAFLVQFPIGFTMTQLTPGSTSTFLYSLHETIGFFILWLALLRLAYRLRTQVNRRESRLASWHARGTQIAHGILYLLLIAVPLTGWLGASAYNTLDLFGIVALPALITPDEARAIWILWTHGLLAFGLMALVMIHIGFALQGYLENDEPEEEAPSPAISVRTPG